MIYVHGIAPVYTHKILRPNQIQVVCEVTSYYHFGVKSGVYIHIVIVYFQVGNISNFYFMEMLSLLYKKGIFDEVIAIFCRFLLLLHLGIVVQAYFN